MQRMPHAGRHHPRRHPGAAKQIGDLPDQPNAILPDIIQPPDKRADRRRPRLRPQNGLVHRKAQGLINLDPLRRQRGDRLDPLHRAGDLHPRIGDPGRDIPSLLHHPLRIGGNHFHGNRPVHQLRDFADGALVRLPPRHPGRRRQRRVRRNPADHPQPGAIPDFANIRRIQKKLHLPLAIKISNSALFLIYATVYATPDHQSSGKGGCPPSRMVLAASPKNRTNSGWGRLGRDLNSG